MLTDNQALFYLGVAAILIFGGIFLTVFLIHNNIDKRREDRIKELNELLKKEHLKPRTRIAFKALDGSRYHTVFFDAVIKIPDRLSYREVVSSERLAREVLLDAYEIGYIESNDGYQIPTDQIVFSYFSTENEKRS